MSTVWVCKFDGTIQCESESSEISLEEMRGELASFIGEDNIVNMEKRSQPMMQLCGVPTGRMNAYEITEFGWYVLNHGVVGRQGFNLCMGAETNEKANIGRVISAFAASNPAAVKDLIGHPLRVYKTVDPITDDWVPDRVNIELNSKGVIVEIWFG